MCDSAETTIDYFKKHIDLMRGLGQDVNFEEIDSVNDFFNV